VRQSVEPFKNAITKKDAATIGAMLRFCLPINDKEIKNPKDSISVAIDKTDGTLEKEMNYEQFRTII